MRFIFFTKTLWSEPPRLRHQLANMLTSRNHEVIFFEKPRFFFERQRRTQEVNGKIGFERTRQLIHHRLRLCSFLTFINGKFELRQIGKAINIRPDDVIINFNYDYGFLEKYSSNVIITIINDDFIGHLPLWAQTQPRNSLEKVIKFSKAMLAVSYPLSDQLTNLGAKPHLFLPWARRPYKRPKMVNDRSQMLYWGSIGSLIDFQLVTAMLDSNIIVNFVGPLDKSEQVVSLLAHTNARYLPSTDLDDLTDVLAKCCCSLLPYNAKNVQVQSITINNRAFDLLACGLPLLYTRLPALLRAPLSVIKPCSSLSDFIKAYGDCLVNFEAYQIDIKLFVEEHNEDMSYEKLQSLIA